MSQPAFRTVLRGYEPADVDSQFRSLQQSLERSQAEVEQLGSQLADARGQNDEATQQLTQANRRLEEAAAAKNTVKRITFADLGERIGSILTLAEEEADDIRRNATKEANLRLEQSTAKANQLVAEADRYAVETRSRANADAQATLAAGKQRSDELVEAAQREAETRREEGEALYEAQQARSSQAATEFERTLGDRRDRAEAEFNEQMEARRRELDAAQQQADDAQNEARRIQTDARSQADEALNRARAEAESITTEARDQAERVRRDSERELAAVGARRDAITAQLANVRQMLGTLGGGLMAGTEQLLEERPEDAASSEAEQKASGEAAQSQ
ncbi:MAG: hypothetical protein ACK5KO_08295 [Arachnia sp.]